MMRAPSRGETTSLVVEAQSPVSVHTPKSCDRRSWSFTSISAEYRLRPRRVSLICSAHTNGSERMRAAGGMLTQRAQ
jgi:hypothetical protein